MKIHSFFYLFILIMLMSISKGNAQTTTIVIPGPLDGNAVRNPFIEELIHVVFQKNSIDIDLKYYRRTYTQNRALRELSIGTEIDLNWSTTSIKREEMLRPIRIPLYQGLIGWRILFIRKGESARFSQISSLDELKPLLAVQRFDWTDYDVFKENELRVEGNVSFIQQSKAVSDGLADYFPRSVLEVCLEIDKAYNSGLEIESTILLKYPAAYYFFVQKGNEDLAKILENGLELAIADGSYMALFQRHFGKHLNALKLSKRRVFNLTNSSFPPNSRLLNENYIFSKL